MGARHSTGEQNIEESSCAKGKGYVENLLKVQQKNFLESNSMESKEVLLTRKERTLSVLNERKSVKPYALQLLEIRASAMKRLSPHPYAILPQKDLPTHESQPQRPRTQTKHKKVTMRFSARRKNSSKVRFSEASTPPPASSKSTPLQNQPQQHNASTQYAMSLDSVSSRSDKSVERSNLEKPEALAKIKSEVSFQETIPFEIHSTQAQRASTTTTFPSNRPSTPSQRQPTPKSSHHNLPSTSSQRYPTPKSSKPNRPSTPPQMQPTQKSSTPNRPSTPPQRPPTQKSSTPNRPSTPPQRPPTQKYSPVNPPPIQPTIADWERFGTTYFKSDPQFDSEMPPNLSSAGDLMETIDMLGNRKESRTRWKSNCMEKEMYYGFRDAATRSYPMSVQLDRDSILIQNPTVEYDSDDSYGRRRTAEVDRLTDSLIANWGSPKSSAELLGVDEKDLSLLSYREQKWLREVPHQPIGRETVCQRRCHDVPGYHHRHGAREPTERYTLLSWDKVETSDLSWDSSCNSRCWRHQPK